MADAWLSPVKGQKDMSSYFRPETLFGPKFESYLNQPQVTMERDPKDKTPLIFQLDRLRSGSRNDNYYYYDGDDSL